MVERYMVVATIIAVVYTLVKFADAKYIGKTVVPIKLVVRDVLLVFGCSIATLFLSTYVEGPIGYFLAMVSNQPVQPSEFITVHTAPPDF